MNAILCIVTSIAKKYDKGQESLMISMLKLTDIEDDRHNSGCVMVRQSVRYFTLTLSLQPLGRLGKAAL